MHHIKLHATFSVCFNTVPSIVDVVLITFLFEKELLVCTS